MFKKLGIGKALLLFLTVIVGSVLVVSSVFFYTSQKAMSTVSDAGISGTTSLGIQSSLIKSMALVHSNILPLLAEADPDSREIRMELVKGFLSEFESLLVKCGGQCSSLKEDIEKYKQQWGDISKDLEKNDVASASNKILTHLNPAAEALFDKLDKAATDVTRNTEEAFTNAKHTSEKTKIQLIVLIMALVSIILVVGFFFQKNLVSSIHDVVTNVQESVSTTSEKSREINTSTQSLSQASTRQAASIQETVASIEELSSMVKLNAEHAKSAAEFSKESTLAATEGGKEISILISSMKEISTSSKKIEEIIAVIDDIAFQTNLLALNAAVEAARAGEQGKGFAVVAEAVRNLAQRSAEAAKEIGAIISASVEQTERGTQVADNSGAALSKIIALIQKLDTLNNEISVASQEQSLGITQLSQAMQEIDQVTQSNASVAEYLSANSTVLSEQAQELEASTYSLEALLRGESNLRQSS